MNAWVIDRDHIDTGRVGFGERIDTEFDAGLKVADIDEPVRFRLKDDDGIVYYGGAIAAKWLNGPEEYAFAPLSWAMNYAGATELQYKDGNGNWQAL